jgi:hypothetical protein
MPDLPPCTILLPVYDGAPWLAETLASVLAQDVPGTRLVAIDDASTDGSAELLAAAARRAPGRVEVRRNPRNVGVGRTLHLALARVETPAVAWIGQDDTWDPGYLASQLARIEATGAAASFAEVGCIDGAGRPRAVPTVFRHDLLALEGPALVARLARANFLCAPGAVFRNGPARAAQLGTANDMLQDHELWLHLALEGALVRNPAARVRYRVHGANLSRPGRNVNAARYDYHATLSRVLLSPAFLAAAARWPDPDSGVAAVLRAVLANVAFCPPVRLLAATVAEQALARGLCAPGGATEAVLARALGDLGLLARADALGGRPAHALAALAPYLSPALRQALAAPEVAEVVRVVADADALPPGAAVLVEAAWLEALLSEEGDRPFVQGRRLLVIGASRFGAEQAAGAFRRARLDLRVPPARLRRQLLAAVQDLLQVSGDPVLVPQRHLDAREAWGEVTTLRITGAVAPIRLVRLPPGLRVLAARADGAEVPFEVEGDRLVLGPPAGGVGPSGLDLELAPVPDVQGPVVVDAAVHAVETVLREDGALVAVAPPLATHARGWNAFLERSVPIPGGEGVSAELLAIIRAAKKVLRRGPGLRWVDRAVRRGVSIVGTKLA